MEFEPTIETLQWISSNADKAWKDNDFKALQYWEEQKQKLYLKAQEKIKSIYYSLDLIIKQQEALIEKIERGEYTAIEANKINKVLFKHREELLVELQRYKNFLEHYKSLYPVPSQDVLSPGGRVDESTTLLSDEIGVQTEKFRRIVPPLQLSDILDLLIIKPFKSIFLSTSVQVIFFVLLILGLVMFLWFGYSDSAQIKMYIGKDERQNIYQVRLVNYMFWNAKVVIGSLSVRSYSPSMYRLQVYLLDEKGKRNLISDLPFCTFTDVGPLPSTYIDLSRGAEAILYFDISCLCDELPDVDKMEIVLESVFPHRTISSERIDVSIGEDSK